uniref:Ig-like domain-containing protein n=1 Tax=Pundamilia nyererei TaxID=303518 RepID=A0A3B4FNI5_9CICH
TPPWRAVCWLLSTALSVTSCVQGQTNSICALKGSSVNLSCSHQHPTSSINWYSVHRGGFKIDTSADGKYSMSADSNLTLTVNNLAENDANIYCCREPADKSDCGQRGISLITYSCAVKGYEHLRAPQVSVGES